MTFEFVFLTIYLITGIIGGLASIYAEKSTYINHTESFILVFFHLYLVLFGPIGMVFGLAMLADKFEKEGYERKEKARLSTLPPKGIKIRDFKGELHFEPNQVI